MTTRRRVVITSVGVISSLGNSLEELLCQFQNGSPQFVKREEYPFVYTAPIINFNFKKEFLTVSVKNRRYLNRAGQLGLTAAYRCLNSIEGVPFTKEEKSRAGIFIGSGPHFNLHQTHNMALGILTILSNTLASFLAEAFQFHGESHTLGTACCASLQAIGEAFRKIKNGELDLALVGGGDSRLSTEALHAYFSAQALYCGQNANEDYIPFAKERYGFVPGEGSALFLLQDLETALSQKRKIYGEILGYGLSVDGFNPTAPHPEGKYAEMAIRKALNDSNLTLEDIDLISSHGTGTLLNEEMESLLIERLFAHKSPYIIALKSWFGHLSAACGALELASLLTIMQNSFLPPIRNLTNGLRDLNYVGSPKSASINHSLIQNFGFGGQNTAMIIKNWDPLNV